MKNSRYFRMVRRLWQARKEAVIVMVLHSIFDAAYQIASVMLPALFIQLLFQEGGIRPVLLCVAALFLNGFLRRRSSLALRSEELLLDQIFVHTITEKMDSLPYYYLEMEEIRRKKEASLYAIQDYGAVYAMYQQSATGFTALVTLLSVSGILWASHGIYFLVLLLPTGLIHRINARSMKVHEKHTETSINLNYQYSYYNGVAVQKKYQLNHRLYGTSRHILDRMKRLNERITEHFHSLRMLGAKKEIRLSALRYLQTFLIYIFPAVSLAAERIQLGTFTLLINAGFRLQSNLNILVESIQQLERTLVYLKLLEEIMALSERTEKEGDVPFSTFESLEFCHVSFRYPHQEKPVLKDISFQMKPGERIALTGLNGAGKTTLIKLILRLYVPESGEILVNGRNIREYDGSYTKGISAVFQDSKVFPLTVGENIAPGGGEEDVEHVMAKTGFEAVMEEKEIDLKSLCQSDVYDDGVQFSGGEEQLLAITRALHRDGPLLILDEPSASLDPIMKQRIIQNFHNIAQGKTVILITHDENMGRLCQRHLHLEDGVMVSL